MLNSRHLLLVLGLCIAIGVIVIGRGPTTSPLVLLITIDSLRPDVLGAYGSRSQASPALDRFAEQADVFTRAISPSSWTKPSIASMLTSTPPSRHLVLMHSSPDYLAFSRGQLDGRDDREYFERVLEFAETALRLPEHMTVLGDGLGVWTTAAFVNNTNLRPEFGFDRGWDYYEYFPIKIDENGKIRSLAPAMNDAFLGWLERTQGPRLAWLHYNDLHYPYGPYEKYLESFHEGGAPPSDYGIKRHLALARSAKSSPETLQLVRRLYLAGLRQFDDYLGALFTELDSRGILEAAMVILASDHGEEFLDQGEMGHGTHLLNSQVGIPFMIRWPGQKERRIRDDVVSLVDVAPTIRAFAKLAPRDEFTGRAITRSVDTIADRIVTSELINMEMREFKAATDGRFKLVVATPQNDRRLFMLDSNGMEGHLVDLNDPEYAEVAEALAVALREQVGSLRFLDHLRDRSATAPNTEPRESNKQIVEELRALGYLE